MTQLPRGRHGLSREYIAEHQRARLFGAVAVVLDSKGYAGTTVSAVAGEAGISKSDFYNQFESKDDCFLAAYDAAVERLRADVLVACGAREGWAQSVCAGLEAALAALSAAPAEANLLLVEGLCAGPDVCARFRRAVESFVPYLRQGAPPAVGRARRRRPRTRRSSAGSLRWSVAGSWPAKAPASADSSRNLPNLRSPRTSASPRHAA